MVLVAEKLKDDVVGKSVRSRNAFEISMLSSNEITNRDLDNLHRIEKDMWAHWLWEYVKCNDCWKVHSKKDIYGKLDLPHRLMLKTVSELEETLGMDKISCPCCSGDTTFIFWDEYKYDILERRFFLNGHLAVLRDIDGEVRWFMDGYIADFEEIYEKEFGRYYWEYSMEIVKTKVEKVLWRRLSKHLLCPIALWTEQSFWTMQVIYNLIKYYLTEVHNIVGSIDGVYESVLGTNTHAMYDILWWEQVWANEIHLDDNTHIDFTSDIFVHRDITGQSLKKLEKNLRVFLVRNKARIQEITQQDRNKKVVSLIA